jgi:hypothetical protein
MKRDKITVLMTNKYPLKNIECRSRARRHPTLQNSKFVNRYSIFLKRDFTQFHV